jgi:hypothetical protein
LAILGLAVAGVAQAAPPWLPTYLVSMDLDIAGHGARVIERVTWFNRHPRPTTQLVFNAHSRYVVPDKEVGKMAKTLELLRMRPSEGLYGKQRVCEIDRVYLLGPEGPCELPFRCEGETETTLIVELPRPVSQGESVTVQLELTVCLPQKQGRWGQWRGVTFLSNWLPVLAVYCDPPPCKPPEAEDLSKPKCTHDPFWQPTPFICWHQPFFNEAGNYHVWVRLPADQKIACTGTILNRRPLDQDRVEVDIEAPAVRDFAFLCSACYEEHKGEVCLTEGRAPVRIHVLALPEHAHYAEKIVGISAEALKAYSKWFAPYPYPDFTIAEGFFGWNGNECSTLVMIDERIFGMPHIAGNYVDYLVSHEICHQWWYNMVGTNGYCETWMDESLATFFSHKLIDQKMGKESVLMTYPRCLNWMPNIRRQDYRVYGMYGTIRRGENGPACQPLSGHGHVMNLFSNCYDKGARIVAMIEERLGEEAFLRFARGVFLKYQYCILRVIDFQRELEAFTGQSWERFFQDWLYSKKLTDWAIKTVEVECPSAAEEPEWKRSRRFRKTGPPTLDNPQGLVRVVVLLEQRAEIHERTSLGFALPGREGYCIRVPIIPEAGPYDWPDPPARFECREGNCYRVEVLLPEAPKQVAVDPDQILVDPNPSNNYWKTEPRLRVTPLYTFLDETDLTCFYDRWNINVGPWAYGAAYNSPWFTRATMVGVRAGTYRMQEGCGGGYLVYRTDFRDVVAGVDGFMDHWPGSHWQLYANVEQRLFSFYKQYDEALRAAAYARYVFAYHSSLYLAPMNFLEGFVSYSDNFLPFATQPVPEGVRWNHATTAGLHYQLNYLTPYWDAEGGFLFDTAYQGGIADLGNSLHGMQSVTARFQTVKSLPDLKPVLAGLPSVQEWCRPVLDWIAANRLAVQVYGAMGLPNQGLFFSLGGSQAFRGFDMTDRQGSAIWGANFELRSPVATGVNYDLCDHVCGIRNIYSAVFYDIGDAYVRNHSQEPVAHGVGAGLRLDVAWFGFVERSVLRFDVAKCVNQDTPVQFWFGFQQPF